jgi:quinol monooxygenase YgiN
MAVMLIARFDGDVDELRQAYDRAHALIGRRGGATRFGELRHHCALGSNSLYIIGVWDSADHIRARWSSPEFAESLTSVGFPPPQTADMTILDLHVIEPPL